MGFFRGMQGRFLLFFLVLDGVILGSLMLTVSRDTREALVAQIGTQLGITARKVSEALDDEVRSDFAALKRVAHEPALRAALAPGAPAATAAEAAELLREAMHGDPLRNVADLHLLDARGTTLASTSDAPNDYAGSIWLRPLAHEGARARLWRGPDGTRLVFAFPVFRGDRFAGSLVSELDLRFVDRIAAKEPSLDIALLDANAALLRGRLAEAFLAVHGRWAITPGAARVIGDHDRYYSANLSHALPGVDWSVVVSIRQDSVLGPVRALELKFLRFGALSALLLACLVLWRLRALVAPLQELERTMHRIMQERNLTQRARVAAGGEVGALAGTFNRLLDSLAHQSEELVRSHAELELQRSKSVDTAKMAALGEMAGGLAHEINTPLSVINLSAAQAIELLETDPPDTLTARPLLERIEATSMRIARIVKGMRSFSRQAGGDPYLVTSVDGMLDDVLTLCQERFKYHMIRLLVERVPKPLSVECRATQIQQVLLNLLNNAHDAVEGFTARWVKLVVEDEGDTVKITVTDSGPGIPAELQARIFQPFFTTKEVGKGTGLGLSISKGIIEEHLGTLTINPESPHTEFVIRLRKRMPAARGADAKGAA